MNPIIKLFVIAAIVAVIGQVMHSASAIYEDQYVLCNFEGECFTFSQDDYLSRAQIEEFQIFFDNNMDTYGVKDLN